jgi:hypothetical protein
VDMVSFGAPLSFCRIQNDLYTINTTKQYFLSITRVTVCVYTVPDLPLCLGVLKHRAPFARGAGIFLGFFFRWVFAYVVQF